MRKADGLIGLFCVVALAACTQNEPQQGEPTVPATRRTVRPGEDGWPKILYFHRLSASEEELRRQALDGAAPGYNLEAPAVIAAHYDEVGPTAHGASGGTTVYWVKEKNEFFIRSDCKGHHVDGFLGPFTGDPREVLKPVAEPIPAAERKALHQPKDG